MIAVLGVDPGVNGGLAVLHGDGRVALLRSIKPDMTRSAVVLLVREMVDVLESNSYNGRRYCYFEEVQHMTGDGGQGSFTFGRIAGLLEGAILMRGISVRGVYPQAWQARLECLSGGNKNVTKRRAKELFPFEKITHNIADALLIAEYGRQTLLRTGPAE